jgi:flagellar motor protein MotB
MADMVDPFEAPLPPRGKAATPEPAKAEQVAPVFEPEAPVKPAKERKVRDVRYRIARGDKTPEPSPEPVVAPEVSHQVNQRDAQRETQQEQRTDDGDSTKDMLEVLKETQGLMTAILAENIQIKQQLSDIINNGLTIKWQ